MTVDEIRAAVLDALAGVAPEADPSSLGPTSSLREELELDSMDHLNFLIAIHEALGVEIPEADYPRVQTLDQLVGYVARALGIAGGAADAGTAASTAAEAPPPSVSHPARR